MLYSLRVGLMLKKKQSPPAGQIPVSAYVGSSKNLKDLKKKNTFWRSTGRFRGVVVGVWALGLRVDGRGLRAEVMKVHIRLPGKGNSNCRGARPVYSFR